MPPSSNAENDADPAWNRKSIPLLSIAIPTYNRAPVLRQALDRLLPQLRDFSDQIELVLSDNASTDGTPAVLDATAAENVDLRMVVRRNETNIGFFGNFVACRQAATGAYLWLLSDDDFVLPGVVAEVVRCLELRPVAFVYLKSTAGGSALHTDRRLVNDCMRSDHFKLTLISSVIFRNSKQDDPAIIATYQNSPFIGFIFLLRACLESTEAVVIEGASLSGAKAPHSVQNTSEFFRVYGEGMEDAIDYMPRAGFPPSLIRAFRKKYLTGLLLRHFVVKFASVPVGGRVASGAEFETAAAIVHRLYRGLPVYWFTFYPLTLFPFWLLRRALQVKKIILRKSADFPRFS